MLGNHGDKADTENTETFENSAASVLPTPWFNTLNSRRYTFAMRPVLSPN